ncbi:hypothetical protein [Methylobacterium haplocladii]|uniref:DUF4304 domain-containing protein n=1 Tax=Methylobacterium haplocladii TaxID=1176176 RepID=A0A512IP26_9HYPH|nr:hypothetical protein [Methylobacterium haplocladii]GEO99466.1 hypothetical protein MHA02_18540 [Methylobacterium haplocladii]GJD83295.1 hypothetical protein HPGCJGGD_1161 [Methylobacterium haplocladii]GLS58943.1 hypothetical protein GCM10007887_16090 [Methylobacterium haplocladii]
MTTQRQAERIFQILTQRHPGFKTTGMRSLYKLPVQHLAGRVFVERTGLGDDFRLMWTVSALFLPQINIGRSIGTYREELYRSDCPSQRSSPRSKPMMFSERLELIEAGVPLPTWRWSDPTTIADAVAMIETHALPKLLVYSTPEGYVRLPHRANWIFYEPREDRMLAYIAAGDLDAARTIWLEQEPLYRGKAYHPGSLPYRWHMQLSAVAEPLLDGDRRALARILHGWEAANVRGTSIEPYWEPTPFPLEAGLD